MTNEELNRIHDLNLLIAEEIKRICEENDIKYFIIAGTLLGAIRHGGFIPWDEDMDFGMLREDYIRFEKACKTQLDKSRFYIQTFKNDKGYSYAFSKIRLKGTRIIEKISAGSDAKKGIFVDIFPFDNVPDSPLKRKINSVERRMLNQLINIKLGYDVNSKSRLKRVFTVLIAKAVPRKVLLTMRYRVMTRYNRKYTDNIVTAQGSYGYEKEIIPRRYLDNIVDIPYENTAFPGFADYDEYLCGMYGDYMQLPPKDKQNKHDVLSVDFGRYAD